MKGKILGAVLILSFFPFHSALADTEETSTLLDSSLNETTESSEESIKEDVEAQEKEKKRIEKILKEYYESNNDVKEKVLTAKEAVSKYKNLNEQRLREANDFSNTKVKLNEKQEDIVKQELVLEKLQKEQKSLSEKIDENKKSLKELEKRINYLKEEKQELEDLLAKALENQKERLVSLQIVSKEKGNPLVSVLISSENIGDFVRNVIALGEYSLKEQSFQKDIEKMRDDLEELNKKQTKRLLSYTKEQKSLAKDEENLLQNVTKEKDFLTSLNKEKESLSKDFLNMQEKEKELLKELETDSKELSDLENVLTVIKTDLTNILRELDSADENIYKDIETTLDTVTSALNAIKSKGEIVDIPITVANLKEAQQKLVDTAKTQLGVPYVWGGTSWNKGLDCSGFLMHVYQKALGINIGRVTTQQETRGKTVALSDIQVGDLIFWGAIGNTYHVAMYVGNGFYIHAPQPNQTVTYSSYDLSGTSLIKRII